MFRILSEEPSGLAFRFRPRCAAPYHPHPCLLVPRATGINAKIIGKAIDFIPASLESGTSRCPWQVIVGWVRRSRALPNCGERLIGRDFSAGFIDVVHVSYTLPDNVVRATIEADFLVLVVGRNISVGALAQNRTCCPFMCNWKVPLTNNTCAFAE